MITSIADKKPVPFYLFFKINGPQREKTCLQGLQTTQAQTSLHMRAD